MQIIILIALLLAITAWIVSSYHQLEQLRILTHSKWQLVLASLHRRNAAMRELIFQLSALEGQDTLLRQLRHAQGDLELSVNSHKALGAQHQQLISIGRNEEKIQSILHEMLKQKLIPLKITIHDSYEQVRQLDQMRQGCIRQYNAAVLTYKNRLSMAPYRQIAQTLQLPEIETLSADELLH